MMEAEQTAVQPDTPLKRCTKCGEEKPATAEFFYRNKKTRDGLIQRCKVCKQADDAAYWLVNLEKIRATNRAYCAAHREEERVRVAAYVKANPDKIKASSAARRAKNKDKMRAYGFVYRAANKDKTKARDAAYLAAHPEKFRAKNARRRTRKQSLPATFTTSDWIRCLEYFGYCCAVCGRPRGLWHTLAQDHWIPLSRGGGYTPDNIAPLCHGDGGCNNHKYTRDPHEWLLSTYGPRKAARIERRIADYFSWVQATAASVA